MKSGEIALVGEKSTAERSAQESISLQQPARWCGLLTFLVRFLPNVAGCRAFQPVQRAHLLGGHYLYPDFPAVAVFNVDFRDAPEPDCLDLTMRILRPTSSTISRN